MTECNQTFFPFEAHFSRRVVAQFEGSWLTTEGGSLLLRQVDRKIDLLRRVARCFTDYRQPERIAHRLEEMLAQRIYGLALGYEDLNDHEQLRQDPLLGVLAGKRDLSEPLAGKSTPGALIYTGDSHAVQGDGEICLTAVETRMKELRIQVLLHKQKGLAWPVAETDAHWIIMGLDKDLHAAMTLAARNSIKFLAAQAKISELDAYALCSIAVSFRVTQVVDIVNGIHALIPKNIFASQLRQQMTMV